MARSFDLIVIGAGSAAKSVAYTCRAAGWSVAVTDSREYGGTCPNRGCDPKKVLVGVASALDQARRLMPDGLVAENAHLDWPVLMRFKRTFTDPVPSSTEEAMKGEGLVTLHGQARFVSAEALEINGERLSARYFAICAGVVPAKLGMPGEEHLITSDDFLQLPEFPESMAFVGGGYIAFEFAHLARRAGAKVTIVHRGQRPLNNFEPYLVDLLVEDSRGLGIDVRLGVEVESVEPGVLHLAGGDKVEAKCIVHAAGRAPDLQPLNLKAANVEASAKGVIVNQYLASPGNSRVYSAGDSAATGAPQLTPVAGYEGRIAAHNILHGNQKTANYEGTPSVVFTIPPLASVGLTEPAAKGRNYDVHTGEMTNWYSSRRLAETSSGYKVLVDKDSGKILGAHLFGEGSDEHINVFALAIRYGLTAEQVKDTLFAYPTHGSNTQYML